MRLVSTYQYVQVVHNERVEGRGHVLCSFLALMLRHELQSRLESPGIKAEWQRLCDDLDALQELELPLGEKRFMSGLRR